MRALPLLFLALALFPSAGRSQVRAPAPARADLAEVRRVVDGDTVVVRMAGQDTTIRLIGVDTAETVDPRNPVRAVGRAASDFLHRTLDGRKVRVELDPVGDKADRYGRTLAYLYREPDGLDVNRAIIAGGYGRANTRYPFSRSGEFLAAERRARDDCRGLWCDAAEPEAPGQAIGSRLVYVTAMGTRYHYAGCRYLARGARALPLAEASRGRLACVLCKPPAPPGR